MPDASRDNLLRDAAALARQGKLDQAVKQYEAALELSPDDWSTSNLIGDLWMKLGDTDAAKRYFDSAANRLADEGFHAKASALFKKILKLWPEDDNARVRAAEIAERQELYADSDTHYRAAIASRRARGDHDGAQALEERLRVRAAEDAASGPAAASAIVPPPTSRPPSASGRWAASVALSAERIVELVAGLEIGAAPPRSLTPAAPFTSSSWNPEAVTDVVAALERVDSAAPAEASEAGALLATLGTAADGWRDLVRIAIRPEWVEAIEERQREAAERAANPPLEPSLDLPVLTADPLEPDSEAMTFAVDLIPSSDEADAFELEAIVESTETIGSMEAVESTPVPMAAAEAPPAARMGGDGPDVNDVNAVFEYLRATFGAAHTMDGRDCLRRGRAWLAAGNVVSGIPALERATSASTVRGEAASTLGRHYLHTGNPGSAVRWLERAAECPADDEQAGQALVYDIGRALQDLGEDLRALAVFTELRRAAGGSWGDVNERIDRLSGLA